MTRLTNDMRNTITHAALAHKFDPIRKGLDTAEDALAREVHASLLPADELKLVAAVPTRWVRTSNTVRVNAGGYDAVLNLSQGCELPVPVELYYGRLGTLPHGDLCDRVRDHVHAVRAHQDARRVAYIATNKLLASVTTLKALRAAWPDGETFYKDYEGATPKSTLPAVRVAEVNKLLGLPPE